MLRADNFTTFMCRLSRNMGTSTSWNPLGLQWACRRIILSFTAVLPQVSNRVGCDRVSTGQVPDVAFRFESKGVQEEE